MMNSEKLVATEDNWVTDIGLFFPGERVVFRGKDLLNELNSLSWMGLLMYSTTGRFFSEQQLELFERLWTLSSSFPDPRLWNNRIAALAGTARSTVTLGVSAATAVTEATLYGHRPNIGAIDFLYRIQTQVEAGQNLDDLIRAELKKHRRIFGFGRPLTQVDERIQPVLKMAKELGLDNGKYLQLALNIEQRLSALKYRMGMNVAGLATALCADQGLSVREFANSQVAGFIAGITPCYVDAVNHPEGTFLPIRCTRIEYLGEHDKRSWC